MELSKLGDQYLLFQYSSLLSRLDSLYKQKKEMESEIASRKGRFEDLYRKGKIKMEDDSDANTQES